MNALPTGHWWRVQYHWCVFLPHTLWLFIDGVQRKLYLLPLTSHSLNTCCYLLLILHRGTHELRQTVCSSFEILRVKSFILFDNDAAVREQHPPETCVRHRFNWPVMYAYETLTKMKTDKKKINKLQFGNFRGGCVIGCLNILWLFTHKNFISLFFPMWGETALLLFSIRVNFKCRASVGCCCTAMFHNIFHFSFH